MPDSFIHKPASLGADLRALRKSRGMTLLQLAEKTGWSVGWVSQVERDISHPSIEDLKGLAKALGVPLSLFFGQTPAVPAEEGYVVRADARRQIGSRQDGLTEELLSPDLTDDFEVFQSTFAPHARRDTFEQRATQEVGYLVSGQLRLWVGARQFDLTPGDSFRIRGEAYRWENPHDVPAVVIWVIAPPVY